MNLPAQNKAKDNAQNQATDKTANKTPGCIVAKSLLVGAGYAPFFVSGQRSAVSGQRSAAVLKVYHTKPASVKGFTHLAHSHSAKISAFLKPHQSIYHYLSGIITPCKSAAAKYAAWLRQETFRRRGRLRSHVSDYLTVYRLKTDNGTSFTDRALILDEPPHYPAAEALRFKKNGSNEAIHFVSL